MDIHLDAEHLLIEAVRRMTSGEKLQMVGRMNAAYKARLFAEIRRRYPEASERE